MPASSSKSRNKVKSHSGQKYSSTNYRIAEKQERLLRYAELYLETRGEAIHTPQQMIEDAVAKYIELLRKKYNIMFPDYLLGEESSPTLQHPV